MFEIQTKLRSGQPSYLKEWLRGIVATASSRNRIGVVIWKETGKGKPDDEALVVLRLKDWEALHGAAHNDTIMTVERKGLAPAVGRETGR